MLTPQSKHKIRRYKGNLAAILGRYAEGCRHLLNNGRYRFSYSKPERQIYRRRIKEQPSKWVEKGFKVPSGRFENNYLNLDITPSMAGIIDAYALPFVRKITVVAPAQTYKTTLGLVCMSWSSLFDPGDALLAYPTESTGVEIMEDRVQRIYKSSPQLRRKLTGRQQDISKHKLRLRNMKYRLAWAGSLTSTAHRSIKLLLMDEVDKYIERYTDTESSTVDRCKLRTRAFSRTCKILMISSTSTEKGFVWIELTKETQAVFVYWSVCPYCGAEQLMDFNKDSFWWPKGDDGHSLDRKEIAAKKLARYICQEPGCKRMWDDDTRDRACRLSRRSGWRVRTNDGSKGEEMFRYLNRTRVQSIGFIVPSWVSYFVSLSEVAAAYLKCKDKDLSPEEQFTAYKEFQNAHRSVPWKMELQVKPVEKLLEFCDDRPEGMLPGGERVSSLVATVDTQDGDLFYLSIWAFGWGFTNEQWLVLRTPVDSFGAIVSRLWESEYYDVDGQQYVIEHAFIDMLGHRTKDVIDFCIQYEGMITPVFGSSRAMAQPYAFSQKEYMPGTDQPLPGGGIRAIRMNSKYYKDNIAIKLSLPPESPGCVHFYKDVGEGYCKQLLSEARDEKGNWKLIGSRDNHYWDNWYTANCLADYLGVKHRIKPENQGDIEVGGENVMVASSQFMGG